ncbi:MAG: Fmu (Sun) domain-containing protein [Desulfonatronovibrio sp. MSAO_Bac4]|nr:MAG: Fmu (Sun) domain-containing protein [Desulfonatronovibrio sp. MSAO_Bac4]
MPHNNPRLSANKVVFECLVNKKDLQEALSKELEQISDPRDRGFVTEVVYGYLRYKGRLDFLIDLHLDRPGKLPMKLRVLLGLAGYELFFLDRVPDYATVSSAVDLCRKLSGRNMTSLVNALLRKMVHKDINSIDTFKKDNPSDVVFCSRFYSCPLWVVKVLSRDYGAEFCLAYLRQTLEKPPLGVRVKGSFFDLWDQDKFVLQKEGNSLLLRDGCPEIESLIQQGRVFRQSFAGQMAMRELGMNQWSVPVWDMCAGSGGKSLLMLDQGLNVYSSDVSFRRLSNLSSISRKYGYESLIFAASGTYPPLKKHSATILIDAPCSGLGVLSRRPDIKWKRSLTDVKRLTKTQADLLDSAAKSVQSGGRIVYITCTIGKKENQTQVNDFLYKYKNFSLEKKYQTDLKQGLNEFFFGVVLKKN